MEIWPIFEEELEKYKENVKKSNIAYLIMKTGVKKSLKKLKRRILMSLNIYLICFIKYSINFQFLKIVMNTL